MFILLLATMKRKYVKNIISILCLVLLVSCANENTEIDQEQNRPSNKGTEYGHAISQIKVQLSTLFKFSKSLEINNESIMISSLPVISKTWF